MNTLQITHRKAVLTLIPATGPTLVLQAVAGASISFAAAGVQGPPGPPGVSGGIEADPGDFTLLFDNQLI